MTQTGVPVTIYHNPACGTSRNTPALRQDCAPTTARRRCPTGRQSSRAVYGRDPLVLADDEVRGAELVRLLRIHHLENFGLKGDVLFL